MIDLAALTFELPIAFTYETSLGPAVLRLTPLRDNARYMRIVLEREIAEEPSPEPEDGARRILANLAAIVRGAEDVHRCCFVSLTIGDETCTSEQGLEFLRRLAETRPTVYAELIQALRADPKEAAADALAGE